MTSTGHACLFAPLPQSLFNAQTTLTHQSRTSAAALSYLRLPASCALRLTHLEAFNQPQLQFLFAARVAIASAHILTFFFFFLLFKKTAVNRH